MCDYTGPPSVVLPRNITSDSLIKTCEAPWKLFGGERMAVTRAHDFVLSYCSYSLEALLKSEKVDS